MNCTMSRLAAVGALALSLTLTGCGSSDAFPDELDVVLPQDQRQKASIDTGPLSLANSTWAAYRIADEGESDVAAENPPPGPYGGLLNGGALPRPPAETRLFAAHFDEAGRLALVTDNKYILAEIYGARLSIDMRAHSTTLPGLAYTAASYGVALDNKVAAAVRVNVRLWGVNAGTATIYLWGTLDGARLDGVFGYLLDFEGGLGGLLLESGGDQYRIYALRE